MRAAGRGRRGGLRSRRAGRGEGHPRGRPGGDPPREAADLLEGDGGPRTSELATRFRRLSRIEARSYLMVVDARRTSDGSHPCCFSERRDGATSRPTQTARWASGAGSSPPIWAPPWSSRGGPAAGGDVDSLGPERMIGEFGCPGPPSGRPHLRDRGDGGHQVRSPPACTTPPIGPWAIRDCSSRSGSIGTRSSGTRSSRAGPSIRSACRCRGSRSRRRTRRRPPR